VGKTKIKIKLEYRLLDSKQWLKTTRTIGEVYADFFNFYDWDYKINNNVYTSDTEVFREEYNKLKMWAKLQDD